MLPPKKGEFFGGHRRAWLERTLPIGPIRALTLEGRFPMDWVVAVPISIRRHWSNGSSATACLRSGRPSASESNAALYRHSDFLADPGYPQGRGWSMEEMSAGWTVFPDGRHCHWPHTTDCIRASRACAGGSVEPISLTPGGISRQPAEWEWLRAGTEWPCSAWISRRHPEGIARFRLRGKRFHK